MAQTFPVWCNDETENIFSLVHLCCRRAGPLSALCLRAWWHGTPLTTPQPLLPLETMLLSVIWGSVGSRHCRACAIPSLQAIVLPEAPRVVLGSPCLCLSLPPPGRVRIWGGRAEFETLLLLIHSSFLHWLIHPSIWDCFHLLQVSSSRFSSLFGLERRTGSEQSLSCRCYCWAL